MGKIAQKFVKVAFTLYSCALCTWSRFCLQRKINNKAEFFCVALFGCTADYYCQDEFVLDEYVKYFKLLNSTLLSGRHFAWKLRGNIIRTAL